MSFKEGDFIKVEYTAWRDSDRSVVFTTEKKKAQESNIYDEHARYEPALVIVGKNTIVRGVDKVLAGMSVNESKKISVEPSEGFGEKNQDLVRVMHVADFRKRDINPEPGMQIDIDGAIAIVKSVNSGRVVVDANHPLAGERLTYEVKILEKLDDEKAKVAALASRNGLSVENAKAEGENVEVSVGENVEKNADYFVNKSAFARSVLRYMPNVKKIVVHEEYSRKEMEKQESQLSQ